VLLRKTEVDVSVIVMTVLTRSCRGIKTNADPDTRCHTMVQR
jgi:hypothetical protein